ncbi:hypothetical protein V8C37DRAFT_391249 [Trichoderma ceciliae]
MHMHILVLKHLSSLPLAGFGQARDFVFIYTCATPDPATPHYTPAKRICRYAALGPGAGHWLLDAARSAGNYCQGTKYLNTLDRRY